MAWFSGWISQTHASVHGFRPDLSRAQSLPVHGLQKWTLGGDCFGGGSAGVFRGGGAGRFVFWGGGAGWFEWAVWGTNLPCVPEKKKKKY